MHRKLLQVTVGIAVLLMGSIAAFSPTPRAYAENMLQDAPSLQGYKFYFTEASGEASRFDRSANGLSRLAGLLTDLGADLETLEWRTAFPTDADLIIIAGPRQDFDASQTARLWSYISEGGKVLMLAEPLQMDGNRARGFTAESGLLQLLWTDLGVRFTNDIVTTEGVVQSLQAADNPSVTVVEATQEATSASTPTATPILAPQPIIDFTTTETEADNPILQGITDPLAFFGARSLEIDLSIRQYPVEPIVFSSVDFYGEFNLAAYYLNGIALYNIGEDISAGFLPLAAAYKSGNTDTRLVLIGDRDFITNGGGLQSSPPNTSAFLYPGNVHFLLNSIAWLLNTEPTTVSFPTPGPTSTPTLVPTIAPVNELGTQTDLTVTMSVSNIRPVEGEIIIYNITVVNNGPNDAENVVVTDELPTGIGFILADGGTYNSETNKWTLDQLGENQAATLRLVVNVLRGTSGTRITNVAQVSSELVSDTNPSNDVGATDIDVSGASAAQGTTDNQQSQEGG